MPATLTVLQRVRRTNLKKLVRDRFGDNASAAGRELKSSHTYMWQILSGHRGIGEKSAREIEERLKLPEHALDQEKFRRTTKLVAQEDGGKAVTYHIVPVRSLDALDAKGKAKEYWPCPAKDCPSNAFAVVVDAGIENTMAEFGKGDVIFVVPLAKREALIDRALYVVRPRGRLGLWSNKLGSVRRAKANGLGGWLFVTTAKGAKSAEHAFGELVVLGRVILIVRELRESR